MNNTTKSTAQNLEHIKLSECVPTDYQRSTNHTQVANIIKRFDEAKLGALTVSLRDGKYHIIDGLHRSVALKSLGYTHALCIVLTGLTYEQEADYFRTQNRDKRLLRPADLFKAGLAAGEEKCITINRIVKENGFQIGKSSKDFYKLASVHALYTIAEDYGYDVLDSTLKLISETWNGIPKASQSESLMGVAEFIHRYGAADFTNRMKDKFAVVFYDYSEAMRIRGSIGSSTSRRKFCRVLVGHYNKGLVHNSRKRLKWEE